MTQPQFTASLHPRWPAGHLVGGQNVGGKFMPKSTQGSAIWAQQVSAALAKRGAGPQPPSAGHLMVGAATPKPTPKPRPVKNLATRLMGPTTNPMALTGMPYNRYGAQHLSNGQVRWAAKWYVDDAQGNQHGPFGTQAAATNYFNKMTAPPASAMPKTPAAPVVHPAGVRTYENKVVKQTAAGPRNSTEYWFDYQGTDYGPYASKLTRDKQIAVATKPEHPVAKGKDLIGQPPNVRPNRIASQIITNRPANTKTNQYGSAITPVTPTTGGQAAYNPDAADVDLRSIADLQGFSGKPEVLTKGEMTKLTQGGSYYVLYRGVSGSGRGGSYQGHSNQHAKTAKQIQDQFRTGGAYYGVGVYGNGYYFGSDRGTAVGYSDRTTGSVIRVALPKNAKIGDYNTLNAESRKLINHSAATPNTKAVFADVGRYAAARGYDAIRVSSGGGGGYYVVLNRSILKVQDV